MWKHEEGGRCWTVCRWRILFKQLQYTPATAGWMTTVATAAAIFLLHFHFHFLPVHSHLTRQVLRKSNSASSSSVGVGVGVQLRVHSPEQVVIENGLFQLTLSTPAGDVTGIHYNDVDNLLETSNQDFDRGYWDAVWNWPDNHTITFDRIHGESFTVVTRVDSQVEVSFVRTWSVSINDSTFVPINIDKRYIIRRGCSGFYAYAIFERPEGWPDIDMDQLRIVLKLRKDMFDYMAISDERQRIMPMAEDRETGLALAYPEAVLLTNPSNPDIRGEVDDKYQYSIENKDNRVHGWICSSCSSDIEDMNPMMGLWMITPSNEFRTAGPIKQDLTSHVGPITLSRLSMFRPTDVFWCVPMMDLMFVSTHYAGKEVGMKFRDGEAWRKVFGPVLVYLNSLQQHDDDDDDDDARLLLWEDAKSQMDIEAQSWPYDFIQSEDFPPSKDRGAIAGQFLVFDRYLSNDYIVGSSAFIGVAAPGEVGSWQRENKGYQFWSQANKKGHFVIENIRQGDYNLYGWLPGIVGDYKYNTTITITPGCMIKLGSVVYEAPRYGPTLWEIGIPDRTASEFYVPSPYPTLMNNLYTQHISSFRQYGLWERYADLYPDNDLVFTVGVDDYAKDWYFAHVTRNLYNSTYQATTWQIIFSLQDVNDNRNYSLVLALASANQAQLQVRFNNQSGNLFTTGLIGNDNAIARHGIHGLYWLFNIVTPGSLLVNGTNIIFLTQANSAGPYHGLMYDYIRLEMPPDIVN